MHTSNRKAKRERPSRPKKVRPPRQPKTPRQPWALREINGNLTLSSEGVIAWYVLAPLTWSFRSDAQRMEMVEAAARCYAALAGKRIYLRGTTQPYPAGEWARALHDNTVRKPGDQASLLPDVEDLPGCPGNTWADYLETTQRHLQDITLDDKTVYLGVRLTHRTTLNQTIGLLRKAGERELRRLRALDKTVTEIVARPGLAGRPATPHEMAYLMHRSAALGIKAPPAPPVEHGHWASTDLSEFSESVTHDASGFNPPTVAVKARRGEHEIERHVAVLTVGRMDDGVEVPPTYHSPWLQATDQLPFPVEWMMTLDLLSGEDVRARVNKSLLAIRDMQRQYTEHEVEEPLDLENKGRRAKEIENELTDGGDVTSTRAWGWLRVAVAANDRETCLERVREVQDLYKPFGITMLHPHGMHDMAHQYPLMREFVPGEPLSTTAHRRDLTGIILAAGMPTVSAQVGDRRGPFLGHTVGFARRAVMYDPFYATEEQEASGLVPILGSLGAGKSVALGKICYNAARRGVPTTILDPSGPLARLTELPEFHGKARTIDLLNAPDGTLNPYLVIQPPPAVNFHGQTQAYRESREWALHERKALALDVVKMLLDAQIVAMPATPIVLQRAIEEVGTGHGASLRAVIEALRNQGGAHGVHAEVIGEHLDAISRMPHARLFFDVPTTPPPSKDDSTLLVVTMAGLVLPPRGVPASQWSHQQRMSVPLLHLAAHYVTRRVYGLPRTARKVIAMDEVGQMGEWGSGKSLVNRIGRDSRKWNLAAYLSSQDPADVLGLDIANLIGGALVGRIEDPDIAKEALRLLRIPDVYAGVLAGLSPHSVGRHRSGRQFVFRDVMGSSEVVQIDLSDNPGLLAALDTTARPGEQRGAA
jgi:hypothetical protein